MAVRRSLCVVRPCVSMRLIKPPLCVGTAQETKSHVSGRSLESKLLCLLGFLSSVLVLFLSVGLVVYFRIVASCLLSRLFWATRFLLSFVCRLIQGR